MKFQMEDQFASIGVIPVIRLEKLSSAAPLAHALTTGGLSAAEVTFRTEGAEQVIPLMKEAEPDMLVGAGTILTLAQAKKAREAGAAFIVSPGLDEEIVSWCLEQEIPVFPGCVTPTEIMRAKKLGLELVKFFPASSFGGRKTLLSLHGPFPDMRFMPTGGIHLEDLEDYLALPYIPACGGSFMVEEQILKSEDWKLVEEKAALAAGLVAKVKGYPQKGDNNG